MKRYLFWLFMIASVGTTIELFLMDHNEDYWQWLPIVLFLIAIPVMSLDYFANSVLSKKLVQIVMLLFAISGLIGIYMHYDANLEFILELYPSESGFTLFWKTIKGATPALAPATMTGLAALGWLYLNTDTIIETKQGE